MQGLVRKTPYGFEPSGEEAQKIHKAMALGAVCRVEYVKTRNYENHKRYFAFIETVFDMQEWFEDKEQMRKWVQMKAGHYEQIIAPNGKAVFSPISIDFAKIDELQFRELFNKSITVVINARMESGEQFIRGLNESQLMRILEFD